MKAGAFRASRIALDRAVQLTEYRKVAGDDTHRVCDHLLGGPVKAPQNLYRLGNGLRGEKAGTEYAFAQARHLAILMQRVKTSSLQTRDLETD